MRHGDESVMSAFCDGLLVYLGEGVPGRGKPLRTSSRFQITVQTLLPGSPWHRLSELIGEAVQKRVAKRLDRAEVRQVLFELLGPQFIAKHFTSMPDTPLIIQSPYLARDLRTQLVCR